MSHGHPNRPQADQSSQLEPIEYGEVFNVSGELASIPVPPRDAADVQAAAGINERAGLVSHDEMTDFARNQGVSMTETEVGGVHSILTEDVGGRVLGQHAVTDEPMVPTDFESAYIDGDPITIGEALEAVAISAGDKPVDQSDADAITEAEFRATGEKRTTPGGVGGAAQSAATHNTHVMRREDMTKLSDVLTDATEKLAKDKAVTKEDAEAVYAAEVQFPWRRDNPEMTATPGGVAASMASAADLNEDK